MLASEAISYDLCTWLVLWLGMVTDQIATAAIWSAQASSSWYSQCHNSAHDTASRSSSHSTVRLRPIPAQRISQAGDMSYQVFSAKIGFRIHAMANEVRSIYHLKRQSLAAELQLRPSDLAEKLPPSSESGMPREKDELQSCMHSPPNRPPKSIFIRRRQVRQLFVTGKTNRQSTLFRTFRIFSGIHFLWSLS